MSTTTSPQRRPSRRRLVPRNLLTYDERRQLREPTVAPTECTRPGCVEAVEEGSVCCPKHTADLARLKGELEQPWDWKDGKAGHRPRRQAA